LPGRFWRAAAIGDAIVRALFARGTIAAFHGPTATVGDITALRILGGAQLARALRHALPARRFRSRFAAVVGRVAHFPGRTSTAVRGVLVAAAAEPSRTALDAEIGATGGGARDALVGIRITFLAVGAITTVESLTTGIADATALGAELAAGELGCDATMAVSIARQPGSARTAIQVQTGARIMYRSAQRLARGVNGLTGRQRSLAAVSPVVVAGTSGATRVAGSGLPVAGRATPLSARGTTGASR